MKPPSNDRNGQRVSIISCRVFGQEADYTVTPDHHLSGSIPNVCALDQLSAVNVSVFCHRRFVCYKKNKLVKSDYIQDCNLLLN